MFGKDSTPQGIGYQFRAIKANAVRQREAFEAGIDPQTLGICSLDVQPNRKSSCGLFLFCLAMQSAAVRALLPFSVDYGLLINSIYSNGELVGRRDHCVCARTPFSRYQKDGENWTTMQLPHPALLCLLETIFSFIDISYYPIAPSPPITSE
jgi:hypothetical protein